ncbi:MAG: VWA domain-containing protein [Planctomycetota bacterium]|jgi:Ca-activated chloride channel family protein
MLVFNNDEYLWPVAISCFTVFLLYLYSYWRKKRWLKDFGSIELIARESRLPWAFRDILKGVFISLAAAGLALVLLGPKWLTTEEQYEHEGMEIVFALDVSLSMLADDIKPNRLQRAKMEIENLVGELHNDSLGLVVFAGKAFSLLPYLTKDYDQIFLRMLNLVKENYTRFVPYGTNIGNALLISMDSFSDKPNEKVLILLTDGEEQLAVKSQAAEAAKLLLEKKNIYLYMIGIGNPTTPTRIPKKDMYGTIVGYEKDQDDKIIETLPNPSFLKEMAEITGGSYAHDATGEELRKIFRSAVESHRKIVGIRTKNVFIDTSRHFLAAAALFLVLGLCI